MYNKFKGQSCQMAHSCLFDILFNLILTVLKKKNYFYFNDKNMFFNLVLKYL